MNLALVSTWINGPLLAVTICLGPFWANSALAGARAPAVPLQIGPHLLLDDFLIESSSNVVRRSTVKYPPNKVWGREMASASG
jgi:hypothetical protein